MRVLVTRPKTDAERTATHLKALGHEAIVAPLLEIRFCEGPEIALDGVQAILATSANGVRALAKRTTRRDIPLYAVGMQSAEAARQSGFADVCDASGDAAALAELTIARLEPKRGALFYAAAAQTRGGLAEELAAKGFDIRCETLYEAVAATAFPEDAQKALASGAVDAALIFSPRTARIFGELAARANVPKASPNLRVLCISEAAAREIRPFGFRHVEAAVRPDQEALLAMLAAPSTGRVAS